MKTLLCRYLPRLLAAVCLSGIPASADIYTVSRFGNTIKPLVASEISMDSETVRIEYSEEDEEYVCTATFVMRNQSDERVSRTIAFPVLGPSPLFGTSGDITRGFKVFTKSGTDEATPFTALPGGVGLVVREKEKQTFRQLAHKAAKTPLEALENVTWEMTWASGETITIRVIYSLGVATWWQPGSNSIARVAQLTYIVRSGALWRGPIGHADISIRLAATPDSQKAGQPYGWLPGNGRPPTEISYPKHAKWTGPAGAPHEVRWIFTNWTPEEDIWIRWASWNGYKAGDLQYWSPPVPYRGADIEFTGAMLDELVARELHLATQYFPREVAQLDRTPLRKDIAEWLYNEIFARHGEWFVVEDMPADAVAQYNGPFKTADGVWHSMWYGRFHHRSDARDPGWYEPTHKVDLSELSELERKNAAFLKTVCSQ